MIARAKATRPGRHALVFAMSQVTSLDAPAPSSVISNRAPFDACRDERDENEARRRSRSKRFARVDTNDTFPSAHDRDRAVLGRRRIDGPFASRRTSPLEGRPVTTTSFTPASCKSQSASYAAARHEPVREERVIEIERAPSMRAPRRWKTDRAAHVRPRCSSAPTSDFKLEPFRMRREHGVGLGLEWRSTTIASRFARSAPVASARTSAFMSIADEHDESTTNRRVSPRASELRISRTARARFLFPPRVDARRGGSISDRRARIGSSARRRPTRIGLVGPFAAAVSAPPRRVIALTSASALSVNTRNTRRRVVQTRLARERTRGPRNVHRCSTVGAARPAALGVDTRWKRKTRSCSTRRSRSLGCRAVKPGGFVVLRVLVGDRQERARARARDRCAPAEPRSDRRGAPFPRPRPPVLAAHPKGSI